MFCIAQLCSYIVRAYYVSQVKWYHSLNIISAVRETNLPWITKIRKPAERIVSNSFVVIMLWVQHALTCPSRPQLDCIPVEDMPFTYSWKQCSTELQMSLPRVSCQMYVIFISVCTSIWLYSKERMQNNSRFITNSIIPWYVIVKELSQNWNVQQTKEDWPIEWPKTCAFFHPKWSIKAKASFAMIAVLPEMRNMFQRSNIQKHRLF